MEGQAQGRSGAALFSIGLGLKAPPSCAGCFYATVLSASPRAAPPPPVPVLSNLYSPNAMNNVSLFTSDGFYIGCARDLLPSDAASPEEGVAVEAEKPAVHAEAAVDVEADDGAHLVSLFRLFLQLHHPQAADDGADHDAHRSWVEDEEDEADAFVGPPYPCSAESLRFFARHAGGELGGAWKGEGRSGSGSGSGGSAVPRDATRLLNTNRSASGADELPLLLALGPPSAMRPPGGGATLIVETSNRRLSCTAKPLPFPVVKGGGRAPAVVESGLRLAPPIVFCCAAAPL
eukprot:gene975-570_t